jgi:hypothetical protein
MVNDTSHTSTNTPSTSSDGVHDRAKSIACPRHGIVDVAADAPCAECGVAAYDLDDRSARDLVRANREVALKARKTAVGVAIFVVVLVATHSWLPLRVMMFNVNVLAFLVAGSAASFGARPLALKLEPNVRLRRLDDVLARRTV